MLRKALLGGLALVPPLLMAWAVFAFTASPVTEANYEAVRLGMTRGEVDAILGANLGHDPARTWSGLIEEGANYQETIPKGFVPQKRSGRLYFEPWSSQYETEERCIIVYYDAKGSVTGKGFFRRNEPVPSWWDACWERLRQASSW